MKLLYYAPRFHTNQVQCMKALTDRNVDVKFCVINKGYTENYSYLQPEIIKISFFYKILTIVKNNFSDPMVRAKYALPSVKNVFVIVSKFKPDAVIVRDPITLPGILFVAIASLLRIKIVVYTQSPRYRKKNSILNYMAYVFFVKILNASWYTPCLGITDEHHATFKNIVYIPFVAEQKENIAISKDLIGPIKILCIGKFEKRKNHALLIEILNELRYRYNFKVTIYGECTSDIHKKELLFLQNMIEKLKMADLVIIRTNITHKEICSQYAKFDLFVLPSTQEPASISNLEAMTYGLAVVCSDTNGTACYTTNGIDGFTFRDNDRGSLKAVMGNALESKEVLIEMGLNAYIKSQREFNGQRYYDALMRII